MKKLVVIIAAAAFMFSASNVVSASSVSVTSVSAVASQETNWDNVLKSYENFVNKYVAAYKKMKEGDTTAALEMAKLLKEAQKLQKQLDGASGEMTPAQLARYAKIAKKLASAM